MSHSRVIEESGEHRMDVVTFTTTSTANKYLEDLSKMGIFGEDVDEVVDRIVCKEIQRLIRQGFLSKEDSCPCDEEGL